MQLYVLFVLGEPIYVSFHLDNRSTKPIRLLSELLQKTSFKGGDESLSKVKLIASNYAEACPERCSQSDRIFVPIPHDSVSTIGTDVLDIHYFIKLFVDVSDGVEYFDTIPLFIK